MNEDPMDCQHLDFEVLQGWHDPTGEAPIVSDFARQVRCNGCGTVMDQTMPREEALKKFPKAITHKEEDS